MATRYQQGRETEYKAQRFLEALGFTTTRAASSKGKADVIAWSSAATRFIQCKRYASRPQSFQIDIAQLMTMTLPPNASAELWVAKHDTPGWVTRLVVRHNHPDNVDAATLDGYVSPMKRLPDPDETLVKSFALMVTSSAKELRKPK